MATINVVFPPNASDADAATYTIDANVLINSSAQGSTYPDNFIFSDGAIEIDNFNPDRVTDFQYFKNDSGSHELDIDSRGGKLVAIPFDDQSPAIPGQHLEVSVLGSSLYVTEGTLHEPAGATLLNGYADQPTPPPVVTPPATPLYVTVHDTTTGADLPDTFSSAYTGPVSGISTQTIAVTPDSLNITALTDNMFIKTGAGNDAVALHGGTNVVDAGTGSNFLTSGGSFDTFFLDARNIPAASSAAGPVPGAIWDTVQGFGHGDAVTLWGIGPGTALAWQKNEGAVGHTGLTLHAITPNGATTSLTLAGVDDKSHLALSYGQSGGANYLYVKAV